MDIFANTHKIVAIVNKSLPSGVAMNTVAHMAAGLVANVDEKIRAQMSFIDFKDQSGMSHKSISALSLIVLRGKSNEIRKIRNKAEESGLEYVDFLETMTGDTYKEQLAKTANTEYDDLTFYGVILFGEKSVIDPITKRQSLWQ